MLRDPREDQHTVAITLGILVARLPRQVSPDGIYSALMTLETCQGDSEFIALLSS